MINKQFWMLVAENWCRVDDGIIVPDDSAAEAKKASNISEDDLKLFDSMDDNEINDILADLGLDD